MTKEHEKIIGVVREQKWILAHAHIYIHTQRPIQIIIDDDAHVQYYYWSTICTAVP